jgi:hypothetical protein
LFGESQVKAFISMVELLLESAWRILGKPLYSKKEKLLLSSKPLVKVRG